VNRFWGDGIMIKKRGMLVAVILSMIVSYLNPLVLNASETIQQVDGESSIELNDGLDEVNEERPYRCEEYFVEESEVDDINEYEELESVYIENEVILIPGEQKVTVTFANENMVIEAATLYVESLLTGEEFYFYADEIEGHVVEFVIYHGEDVIEDEILLVSIELEIQGQEDALLVEFANQEIEISYVVSENLNEDKVLDEEIDDEKVEEVDEIEEVEEFDVAQSETSMIVDSSAPVIIPSIQQVLVNAATAPQSVALTATNRNNQDTLFDLRLGNANLMGPLQTVRFAVWSERNGQNDLVWYNGTSSQGGNVWTATADVRQHRYTGRYLVHVWGTRADGSSVFIGGTHFNVTQPSGPNPQIVNNNPSAGTFDVVVSGIQSPSGVNEVRVAVWSQEGQGDLVWYPGVRQNDGSHRVTVHLANHNFNLGNYHIHAWLTAGNGQNFAVTTRHNVTSRPQVGVTATNRSGTEIFYDLRATNVAVMGDMQQVRFAVWSERSGQSDLIWYEGSRQANGSWTAAADIRQHRHAGRYHVHVWGVRTDGSGVFIGGTQFNVTPPSGPNPQVVNVNPGAGTFDVVVSGIRSVSGISEVRVAVWSQEGQRDLAWYSGVRQSDGSHRITASLANHNFNLGNYHIHAWLTTGNGQNFAVTTRHNVTTRPQATVTATNRGGTDTLFDLRLTNATVLGPVSTVRFAVWSERNGQNDLVWYNGTLSGGVWTATADVRNHRYTGRYHVHVWGTRPDGSSFFMGATTFNVAAPTVRAIQVQYLNTTNGTFDVAVSGINSLSGVNVVRFFVWSRPDQSDMRWNDGVRQSDGSFRTTVNIANHNFNPGTYTIHAHVLTGNGQLVTVGTNAQMNLTNFVFSQDIGGGQFRVGIINPSITNAAEVFFPTWSERSGQRDMIWYRGTREGNRWTAIVVPRNHRYHGTFITHVYASTVVGGPTTFLRSLRFQVPESAMRTPVPHWSMASMPHNPGGRPISEVLGFDSRQWLNRLEYHEHTSFYLGTPFRGFNARNPNGNPHFSPPMGVPGMNCTGFVWHTILAMGVPGSRIPNMEMTVPQTGPGWGRWIRENNVRTYNFYSVADMNRSGVLERGDIIWSWATTPGQLSDWHHVGIYWGNGRYWHSCPLLGRNAITSTVYGLTGNSLWTVVKMN